MEVSGRLYAHTTLFRREDFLVLTEQEAGLQSRSGPLEERGKMLHLPRIEPQFLGHRSRSLLTKLTELSRDRGLDGG
jgi:hypothetical protein